MLPPTSSLNKLLSASTLTGAAPIPTLPFGTIRSPLTSVVREVSVTPFPAEYKVKVPFCPPAPVLFVPIAKFAAAVLKKSLELAIVLPPKIKALVGTVGAINWP